MALGLPKGQMITLFEEFSDDQMFWFLIYELRDDLPRLTKNNPGKYGSWCTNIVNDKDWW